MPSTEGILMKASYVDCNKEYEQDSPYWVSISWCESSRELLGDHWAWVCPML